MIKSILFVLLIGTVYVNGLDLSTFLWDNIVQPAIDSIVENTTNLLTGWISGLFSGKRSIEWLQAILPVVPQALPMLVNAIYDAFSHLITMLLPLARQQVLHLPGFGVHVGIRDALDMFDMEIQAASHKFFNTILQFAQTVLSTVQVNSLYAVLNQFVSNLNQLVVQVVTPIVNGVFQLLTKPIVSQWVGQLLG